ncbi:MAG: RNA polymerase sigma factor SigZ [Candidatus Riflebacteria bacterium GWC2_50_8]|nr:MAG: RNA polymerase sigma factor SigZ [Candidatus Riflebacteria bacterium GWC2_50_8]
MNTIVEIWNRYHSNLLVFIQKRVNDKAAAEDILHDIFIRVHLRIDTLENRRKIESWLYQITRNAIIDYYRSRKPTEELSEWLVQQQASSEESNRLELSSCLTPMIQLLPEKYRRAVQLSEIEGKTGKEVAEKENISLSGAKSRVQRGRALLKTMLHECCKLEINKMNQIVGYDKKDDDCKLC